MLGSNNEGQLGNGNYAGSDLPVTVNGISSATAISTGYDHACALLSGGSIKCWGRNDVGELGNGQTYDYSTPQAVTSGTVLGLTFTTAPRTVAVAGCSGKVTVQLTNFLGQATNASANLPFGITSSSPTGLYSDSSCSTEIDVLNIASGTSNSSFFQYLGRRTFDFHRQRPRTCIRNADGNRPSWCF